MGWQPAHANPLVGALCHPDADPQQSRLGNATPLTLRPGGDRPIFLPSPQLGFPDGPDFTADQAG